MRAVFDTNILIDYLHGRDAAKEELERFSDRAVSVITWAEVLIGATPAVEASTRAFLASFSVVDLDVAIAERAVALRRRHGLRLPDAAIWGTAQSLGALFVTRDVRDFRADDPGIRVPYRL